MLFCMLDFQKGVSAEDFAKETFIDVWTHLSPVERAEKIRDAEQTLKIFSNPLLYGISGISLNSKGEIIIYGRA